MAQSNTDTLRLLVNIRNGVLFFSDSSSLPVPHWQDTAYTTFVLVRHAEKILDGSKDPDLTPEGHVRAARLGQILETFGVDSVYATDYKRNRQTAAPVQQIAQTPPVLTYTPGGQADLLNRLSRQDKGKRFVIVGHQNTVPQALNLLKAGADYQFLGDFEYNRLFLVFANGNPEQTEILELYF